MPTILESAKEASYTALGLNVLLLDEMNERLAGPREQVTEQLNIARDHAKKARADWQKQAGGFSTSLKDRFPFDLGQVTESVQSRVQPVARRSWQAAEPTVTRFAEFTPAPLDGYVKDAVNKLNETLVVDTKTASKKKASKNTASAAKKSAGKKSATSRVESDKVDPEKVDSEN